MDCLCRWGGMTGSVKEITKLCCQVILHNAEYCLM